MTAEFLTALSVLITTVVGAVISLRQAFKKTSAKIDEVHDRVTELKDTINGNNTRFRGRSNT